MSVSSVNFLNPSSFAPRAVKPAVSIPAGLSAGSPDATVSGDEFTAAAIDEPAPAQSPAGSGTPNPSYRRDADDKIIAAWFQLMKPNVCHHSGFIDTERKRDDPGRLPDPLYEPTKATVPDSLQIITFNDLMRALAPKKPHWKHYDHERNQFQVGSQERD